MPALAAAMTMRRSVTNSRLSENRLCSWVCAAAPSIGTLVAFRVAQGFFGGMLIPAVFSAVFVMMPERHRLRAAPALVGVSRPRVVDQDPAHGVGRDLGGDVVGQRRQHRRLAVVEDGVDHFAAQAGSARDLDLTQGVVSRLVQTLEAQLGVTLFLRQNRRIAETV